MPRRRPRTNGEGSDDVALQQWAQEIRATLVGPARAIFRHLAKDGRPAEEALRAMAEHAGVAAEDALPLLEWEPRMREAAEILKGALAEPDGLAVSMREEARGLLDELRECLALLDKLEARVGKSDAEPALDPAAEREVDAIVANLGCSRGEARRMVEHRDWSAFEAAEEED